MSATYTTDLRHFLDARGNIALPAGPGRAMADFLVRAVATATHLEPGSEPIPCIGRNGRKRCTGFVAAALAGDGTIAWRCPVCDRRGVVTGWSGTFWDLSRRDATVASE